MLGHNERLARKLNEQGGRRAWAAVLDSKQEWASSGGSNVAAGQAGSFTIHQRLRLRVEPDGEPPFEATVKQVFNDARGWHIPHEGDSVTVIYDPDDHSKLVIDLDAMPVASGFDRDAAAARHERVMARMQDPAAWRQQVADMQASAAGQVRTAAAAAVMRADPEVLAPSGRLRSHGWRL